MGLDATVMCNCFRDGKTTPLPFPREWLEVDDEGYLNLKKEHDCSDNWDKQCEWEESCCEHENMDLVCEHISNWTGYRQFQEALSELGWRHFPVLKEQLPEANGGLTPAKASAQALQELDHFAAAGEVGVKTVLVDTASDTGLYEYVPAHGGVFLFCGTRGINVGLGEFEFFAVDATSGEDLFLATRFRQFRTGGEQISGDSDDLVWQNLDTGEVYNLGIAIPGRRLASEGEQSGEQWQVEYPSDFHVEHRPWLVTEFEYIVKALRTVFDASVQTGNPVRWC